jgi:hypothetical protein
VSNEQIDRYGLLGENAPYSMGNPKVQFWGASALVLLTGWRPLVDFPKPDDFSLSWSGLDAVVSISNPILFAVVAVASFRAWKRNG